MLTDWANRSTTCTYFPDDHVKGATSANGTTGAFTYDNAQRLSQISNQQAKSSLISVTTH